MERKEGRLIIFLSITFFLKKIGFTARMSDLMCVLQDLNEVFSIFLDFVLFQKSLTFLFSGKIPPNNALKLNHQPK